MDRGPWSVYRDEHGISIQSADFTHDVCLNISGDFEDSDQKECYCLWLAATLNGVPNTTQAAYSRGYNDCALMMNRVAQEIHDRHKAELQSKDDEIDQLRGLLREWRQVADDAKDLTFVPVARKTDAALAGEPSLTPGGLGVSAGRESALAEGVARAEVVATPGTPGGGATVQPPAAQEFPKGAVSVVNPQGTEETGIDRPAAPDSSPRPMAWLGFPEGRSPPHDVIYDGTRRLPDYRYTPIWRPEDHPATLREKARAADNQSATPTTQHAPGCPRLRGENCECDGVRLA